MSDPQQKNSPTSIGVEVSAFETDGIIYTVLDEAGEAPKAFADLALANEIASSSHFFPGEGPPMKYD